MSSKKFTDLNAGTIGADSIFAQAQEPALSGDPYTSTKVSATQIANYVAKGQAFTELNNHTIIEAITGGSGAGTVILTMDEYLALTPAQQTDGHIYVISDFACLFCYGRQYNALKELTRAQYDQLTPAQQSDGTLYIITDEETTADDIPYSSGVSVADKLDSLSTVESVNVSYPAGVSYHHGYIAKVGKLVVCNLFLKVETTVANNGVLINDMPLSAYAFRAPKYVGGSQYVNDTVSGAVFMDTSNARLNIMTAITGTTSNPLYVSMNFSYFTT